MNIEMKLDATGWGNFIKRATQILSSSDSLLKRAFLVVWPKEAASHFDREEGWEGKWAEWKASTRAQRIGHEIRTASAKGIARARKANIRPGGKLLQVSGRLRTETVLEPIMTHIPGGMKVESPTPYSGFLDEGTSKMVARPFMWLGDDAQETMSKVFAEALGDSLGGSA